MKLQIRCSIQPSCLLLGALLSLFAMPPSLARAQYPQLQFFPAQVNLFAGNGQGCSDTGNGGSALAATLCQVTSVAVDQAGNTYIVDTQYNTVRKVDIHGNISTFAGVPVNAGFTSSSGDGGPATAAYIDQPTDVAIDPSGNVYIAESYASHIRVVNAATGIITTFVGGASGNFHGGTGAGVALGEPIGIAFDPSGNLYIGTFGQYFVIKVTPAGVATAFAGTGATGYNGDNIQATVAQLTDPLYVSSDLSGNIYIEDGSPYSSGSGNCRIRKVTPSTGIITTVAGNGTCGTSGDGGAAISAQIDTSFGGFGLDPAGDIFFNTVGSLGTGSTIRKVDIHGNINTIVGGGATPPSAFPFSATGTYFAGINAARLDNNGNLLMPIATGISSNYSDNVVAAGSTGIIQFGNHAVGSTSAALTITLEDTAATTLTLLQTTYTASEDFTVSGGTCIGLTSLISGNTCTLTVTFTPTVTGARTGSITVLSNSSIGSQTIVLQGTGTPSSSTLLPAALTFSAATGTTSSAQTSTFTNTGTAAITITGVTLSGSGFATTNNCPASLAVAANCTIGVTFAPTQAIAYSGTATVNSSSTSASVIMLSGTGTTALAPIATLNPTSIAFGNQTVNTTSNATVVSLTNTGTAALTISGVTLTGTNPSDFIDISACGASLAINASCNIAVNFAPQSTTSFSAALSIADNAAGSPQPVSLTGTGTAVPAPIVSISSTSLAFPNTAVGSTASAITTTVTNTGNATLTFASITLAGANPSDFTITSNTCGAQLAVSAACSISITFTPVSTTNFAASINISDNLSSSPQAITLTGTGTGAPGVTLAPGSLTYTTAVGSTSAAQTVTLTNPGNLPLAITSSTLTGAGFTITSNTCGSTLAASVSCAVSITFTPTAATSYSGGLTFSDNATTSPQAVLITGTGTGTPSATLAPATLSYSTTVGSTSAAQTVTLTNSGNLPLTITSATLSGSGFTLTTNTCGTTLAAAASCAISITFTPIAAITYSGSLTFSDNISSSPQIIPITGTGTSTVTDYTLTSPNPLQTIQPGAIGTFPLASTPIGGSYNSPIALTVTGLPTGATATFAPPSITPGTTGIGSVLSIQTSSFLASSTTRDSHPLWLASLLFFPLFALRRRYGKARLLSLLLLLCILSSGTGCGGGYFGPQPKTYSLIVTGTSGSIQHSTTLTLTVQ